MKENLPEVLGQSPEDFQFIMNIKRKAHLHSGKARNLYARNYASIWYGRDSVYLRGANR